VKLELKKFLEEQGCYSRQDSTVVTRVLSELGVFPPRSFVEFYEGYEGGFGSDYTGFQLLELAGDSEFSIQGATQVCRDVHGFLPEHLVITDLVGDGLEVYDCARDVVYSVDFEGGSEALIQGKLEPTWFSFESFLNWYFLGVDPGQSS
jgi:hypothetical protein